MSLTVSSSTPPVDQKAPPPPLDLPTPQGSKPSTESPLPAGSAPKITPTVGETVIFILFLPLLGIIYVAIKIVVWIRERWKEWGETCLRHSLLFVPVEVDPKIKELVKENNEYIEQTRRLIELIRTMEAYINRTHLNSSNARVKEVVYSILESFKNLLIQLEKIEPDEQLEEQEFCKLNVSRLEEDVDLGRKEPANLLNRLTCRLNEDKESLELINRFAQRCCSEPLPPSVFKIEKDDEPVKYLEKRVDQLKKLEPKIKINRERIFYELEISRLQEDIRLAQKKPSQLLSLWEARIASLKKDLECRERYLKL